MGVSLPLYCSAYSRCSINISRKKKENKAETMKGKEVIPFSEISGKWVLIPYKIDVRKYSVKCFKTVGEKPTYSVKEI